MFVKYVIIVIIVVISIVPSYGGVLLPNTDNNNNNNNNNNNEPQVITSVNKTIGPCLQREPCGWAFYNGSRRLIQYWMKNACFCEDHQKCIQEKDQISLHAFVFYCHTVEGGEDIRIFPKLKSNGRIALESSGLVDQKHA